MEQILLNGIKVEELIERISKVLDSKLNQSSPAKPLEDSNYLSRKEVAKLLKITLPTLHDWTRQGWLQSYKIGNRVYYRLNEVEAA